MTDRTRLVWLESPTNPLLRVVDIDAVGEIVHGAGAIFAVDSTFASPVLQRPLELGADIVVHSSTKFLGRTQRCARRCRAHLQRRARGTAAFPSERCRRGAVTVRLLAAAPGIEDAATPSAPPVRQRSRDRAAGSRVRTRSTRVHYPGLESHPGHALARRQMGGRYGGVVSFEVSSGDAARSFLERVRVFTLAESLGAVESLAESPAIMTHASIPEEMRTRVGVSDGLVRLSVGIEDVDDLTADLEQALA